jgi:hypothetical protein
LLYWHASHVKMRQVRKLIYRFFIGQFIRENKIWFMIDNTLYL